MYLVCALTILVTDICLLVFYGTFKGMFVYSEIQHFKANALHALLLYC